MDYSSIRKIKIKGRMFAEETGMELFSYLNKDGAEVNTSSMLIYGKNGVGKSTISNAIYCMACKNDCEDCVFKNNKLETIKFLTEKEKDISSEINNNTFVYNEVFVEKKIRFNSSGLDTIVMFDKQKELDDKINSKKIDRKIIEDRQEEITVLLNQMSDKKNNSSSEYWEDKMKNILKNRWAREGRFINNRSINSVVNIQKIEDIYSNKSDKQMDVLKDEYEENKKYLEKMRKSEEVVDKLKEINIDKEIDNYISELLKKKIEQPDLSEREKKIFDLVQNEKKQSYYKEVKEAFSNDNVSECPFCFQTISKEYKENLVKDIEVILNPSTERHIQELNEIEIPSINNISDNLKKVNEKKYEELCHLIEQYRLYVEEINKMIQSKKDNVYKPIDETINLYEHFFKINNFIIELEQERKLFNKKINDMTSVIEELVKLNDELGYYEIKDDYEIYIDKKKKFDELQKEYEDNKKKIKEISKTISKLESEKSNTKVAMEEINQYLEYIFFEKDRIKLENDEGKYVVKVRNEKIQLNQLSVGEKNAISLCYFFSLMGQNKKIDEKYNESSLIILDDPISSFDFENKIGIYSFLESVFRKILLKNNSSRIICFTHSLEVTYNLQKVFDSIKKGGVCTKELKNKQLIPFNKNSRNEYSLMLKDVYDFAKGERISELEASIGNTMRKVLEAYGTFNYKLGMIKLFSDDEILSKVKDISKKEKLQNLAYRLVLNTESHREEHAASYPEELLGIFVSNEEKQKTARVLLGGLYLIDDVHIRKHINTTKMIQNIEKWKDEI